MPNRTLCSVLDSMRKAYETRNFSYLPGLIEEAQDMANRMEASLYDSSDYKHIQTKVKDAKKELETLEAKLQQLDPNREFKASSRGLF